MVATVLSMEALAGLGLLLLVVVVIRIVQIYRDIQHNRIHTSNPLLEGIKGHQRTKPCKTMVVLGSGGHTSEMLHMVQQLDASLYRPLIFVVAATDHTSVRRLEATLPATACTGTSTGAGATDDAKKHTIYTIPRSREVGQSYISSLGTTLYALVHAIGLTIRIRPELLLCNGPGTCVPLVMGAWILRICGFPCKFVFCESYCRVQTLSLSGRLLYPMVDCFFVHWESLQEKYPLTYRLSTFVDGKNNDGSESKTTGPSSKQQKKEQ